VAGLTAGAMALALFVWVIRTFIDYRRWNRLAKVQSEVHAKLLDRFSNNEELLAYIQSPAGARFLSSAPITLEAAPRSVGAPLGRIMLSIQVGVVLASAGAGLQVIGARTFADIGQPLRAVGILVLALGVGFLISAIIS